MVETAVMAAPVTMGSLDKLAAELTDDLLNVRSRLDAVYDAMNGERPQCESGDAEGKASGCVSEIKRRIGASSAIVTEIKKTLTEIESIVLSEAKTPQ